MSFHKEKKKDQQPDLFSSPISPTEDKKRNTQGQPQDFTGALPGQSQPSVPNQPVNRTNRRNQPEVVLRDEEPVVSQVLRDEEPVVRRSQPHHQARVVHPKASDDKKTFRVIPQDEKYTGGARESVAARKAAEAANAPQQTSRCGLFAAGATFGGAIGGSASAGLGVGVMGKTGVDLLVVAGVGGASGCVIIPFIMAIAYCASKYGLDRDQSPSQQHNGPRRT